MNKNKLYKNSLMEKITSIITNLVFLSGSIIFLFLDKKLLPDASDLLNLLFEIFSTIIFLVLFIYIIYTNENSYLYLDLKDKKFIFYW